MKYFNPITKEWQTKEELDRNKWTVTESIPPIGNETVYTVEYGKTHIVIYGLESGVGTKEMIPEYLRMVANAAEKDLAGRPIEN
jgi:hypothetical protein